MSQTCRYLGLIDDANTSANFPSSANACHALHPAEVINFEHQRKYCLRSKHTDCQGYIDGWEGGIPRSVRQSNRAILQSLQKKFLWIPLAAVLVAILIIGFTGMIPGFSFPFSISQEQEPEPIVFTRTNRPTTISTLTQTLQPTLTINLLNTAAEESTLVPASPTLTVTITPTSTPTETTTPTITDTLTPFYTRTFTMTPSRKNSTSSTEETTHTNTITYTYSPTQTPIQSNTPTVISTPSFTPTPTYQIYRSPTPERTNILTTIEYILTTTAQSPTLNPTEEPTE